MLDHLQNEIAEEVRAAEVLKTIFRGNAKRGAVPFSARFRAIAGRPIISNAIYLGLWQVRALLLDTLVGGVAVLLRAFSDTGAACCEATGARAESRAKPSRPGELMMPTGYKELFAG
ncbi:hypothetical protein B5V01_27780 [Mesorhizobium erdmanii]|uniref:Uncharacterized protein n=2 Tax=Mesorhizobium TaxID=68287 RepID=A0A3M9X0Q9_9HYPH|nr:MULTISPECIES: hypothetical protein [Mesorhizobium]RNJ41276.1 hypothetical protein DNR46_35080 [Mesorhizobium japonicum]RXT37919.1 hypothetical protein B5V01_27780 [Mesorhizobium erdmanii]